MKLDRDYTSIIRELLQKLSETGSHFESLEEEAQLKKEIYNQSEIYTSIIDPIFDGQKTSYEIPQMNLRIIVDGIVPADVFMIYDQLSKSVGFQYIEWPIDRIRNYNNGGIYGDGYYLFKILSQEDLDYDGPEEISAEEIYRFNEDKIVCLVNDLDMMLSQESINYLQTLGYYPINGQSLSLIEHLTFEKLH